VKSKITDKYQITVPKKIRDLLKLDKKDLLEWKVEDGKVVVEPVAKPFLHYRGSIEVGPGNIEEDIEKARQAMAGKTRSAQSRQM
jgi:AbrB family looped-hinge helix DNA binding protein